MEGIEISKYSVVHMTCVVGQLCFKKQTGKFIERRSDLCLSETGDREVGLEKGSQGTSICL